jgi:uncharacterized membrane protein YeaQ/YmgE (transglycosylase-associated protein family)
MGLLSLIIFLIVAAVCALIAEKLVPGTIPGGFLTAAVFGVIGAWVGGSLLGSMGPALGGVALVPCIAGSALLVFLLSIMSHGYKRSRAN